MLIALYPNHHHLPFWHSPQQPHELFNPEIHGEREVTFRTSRPETRLVKDMWLWPVLMGLHTLDLPVMAHVSAFRRDEDAQTWHIAPRVWIQITTLPPHEPGTIPLVLGEGGKVLVKHLWGGDNGTHNPHELLPDHERATVRDAAFWQGFFHLKLHCARLDAIHEIYKKEREMKEAEEIAKLYQIIPAP